MKKVFKLQTTDHPNAVHGQAHQVNAWVAGNMELIARQYYEGKKNLDSNNRLGPTVDVIVEIIQ